MKVFDANRPCQKCGCTLHVFSFNKERDVIERRCRACGYECEELPLDRAPKPEDKDLPVTAGAQQPSWASLLERGPVGHRPRYGLLGRLLKI